MNDIYDASYIEAIYDFYFVLETLFAGGKFRTDAVLKAFKENHQLRCCVQRALSDPGFMIMGDQRILTKFRDSYGQSSVDDALKRIVELRGYLHHHTQKRRDSWHPDDQRHFECDALFLQAVTYNVAFVIAEPYLWDKP